MKFSPTTPDENYFRKWCSENGKWEVGLTQMLFGVRVRAGRAGDACPGVDYCAGPDPVFQMQLLAVIVTILEHETEDLEHWDIQSRLPGYERRPINQDPCWERLKKMANACSS